MRTSFSAGEVAGKLPPLFITPSKSIDISNQVNLTHHRIHEFIHTLFVYAKGADMYILYKPMIAKSFTLFE